MQTILELWDEETAHLINTYASLPAAFAVVAAAIREHGGEAIENWILLRVSAAGDTKEVVAEGKSLARISTDAVQ